MAAKADDLTTQGRVDDAIALYAELVDRYGDNEDAEVREQVARALQWQGYLLGQQGKSEERIRSYDALNADAPE